MVGWGSDTNLSRPICDTILKRLERPTKDRTAYWYAFAKWISLHQHYIIDGDTYKRQIMPHEYNNISYTISTSDYGWNTNRNSNYIHPASLGCRPGTYPLIEEEAEEELNASKHRSRVMIIAQPVPATVVIVICEPRGLSNPITMGIKTSKA